MIEEAVAILGLVQIILQLSAAYFAYKVMKLTGRFRAWSLIVIALIIMAVRRITAELITMNLLHLGGTIELMDRLLLPLVISMCLTASMYELAKIFSKKISE